MLDLISDMLEAWDGILIIVAILALIALTIFMALSAREEAQQWEVFKKEHNCKVVAHIDGGVTSGVGPVIGGKGGVGIAIVTIPDKTGWLCDDGITYFK